MELLAVLVAIMILPGMERASHLREGTVGLCGGTDNKGNTYIVDKLQTTSFPLGAVLMELSAQMQEKGFSLRLGWLPREANQPADDLTNEVFTRFLPEKRVAVTMEDLPFIALRELLSEGAKFQDELADKKAERRGSSGAPVGTEPLRGCKAGRLRERDPW